MLYPKRRIESYSMMGTIVSPNKILLKSADYAGSRSWGPIKTLKSCRKLSAAGCCAEGQGCNEG